MTKTDQIPYVRSEAPVGISIEDNGRVLVLKSALFNPVTAQWHDIRIVSHGWKVLGFNVGGGVKFTSVTEEMARQIQMTYGIVLKTLHAEPNGAAFWSDGRKTSYFIGKNASDSLEKGKPFRGLLKRIFLRDTPEVKTSLPFGEKKGDLLLSEQDAARFGATQMTLHDAVQKGIFDPLHQGAAGNAAGASSLAATSPQSPLDAFLGQPIADLEEAKEDESLSSQGPTLQRGEVSSTSPVKKKLEKGAAAEAPLRLAKEKATGDPIARLPSIPTYRASKTPIETGYDNASFAERKRRLIAHLDQSSPIPFSAFVDQNKERKIETVRFRNLLEALRKLAIDPESKDADAKYMRNLLKHWFRAAFHYLDKNSNPGDGYPQILAQISLEIQNADKARAKAKELYWRQHATLFWMTLVDLFAREKISIELLYKNISKETNLNPLF